MANLVERIAAGLSERLASTWVLLSDTTYYLSRTSVFNQYEGRLKDLRSRLSLAKNDDEAIKAARDEIVEIRKSLRLQGYDLSLGRLDLAVKGFRNDAAVVEGFRRLVLFIGRRQLWALAGEENHRRLHDMLERELERHGPAEILQKHYLWFSWNHGLLTVSGSDTEDKNDFELLVEWCALPENKLFLLSRLRRLR